MGSVRGLSPSCSDHARADLAQRTALPSEPWAWESPSAMSRDANTGVAFSAEALIDFFAIDEVASAAALRVEAFLVVVLVVAALVFKNSFR